MRVEICFFREQCEELHINNSGNKAATYGKNINLNVACVGDLIDIDMNIANLKEFHIVS